MSNSGLKLSRPPKHLSIVSEVEQTLILNECNKFTDFGNEWAEKIRKYVSFYGRNLKQESKIRFSEYYQSHLLWMSKIIYVRCNNQNQVTKSDAPIDHAYLSALFYCNDALGSNAIHSPHEHTIKLQKWLVEAEPQKLALQLNVPEYQGNSLHLKDETLVEGLIIISPSPYSLYTLSVYSILRSLGVPITAIIVRRFSPKRFFEEWKRDGFKLVKKIWRKLILKSDENSDKSSISLKSLLSKINASVGDVRKLAKYDGITIIEVDDLEEAAPSLIDKSPKLAIFTGGGMIGSELLSVISQGVINIHMGSLPMHKGMDVIESPILEGFFNNITLTAHLMDLQLDSGAVISRFTTCSDEYQTLGALRNEVSSIMPLIAVDSALGLMSGRLSFHKQNLSGRQYYFVHQKLLNVIQNTLNRRFYNPAIETKAFKTNNVFLAGFSLITKDK